MKGRTAVSIVFLLMSCCAAESPKKDESTRIARQYYFNPGYSYFTRQIADGIHAISDVFLLGLMGLPILGLVGMAILPLFGVNFRSKGLDATNVSNKRAKRGLSDLANDSMSYVTNVVHLLSNLEETFHRYDVDDNDCRLWTICQVHFRRANNPFAEKIRNITKKQKDMENSEIIPIANLVFNRQLKAAEHGQSRNNCSMIYSRCNTASLIHLLQDQN